MSAGQGGTGLPLVQTPTPCVCGEDLTQAGACIKCGKTAGASSHEVVMVEGRGYCEVCHPGKGWQRHVSDERTRGQDRSRDRRREWSVSEVSPMSRQMMPTCPACGFFVASMHGDEWWCMACPWDNCGCSPSDDTQPSKIAALTDDASRQTPDTRTSTST